MMGRRMATSRNVFTDHSLRSPASPPERWPLSAGPACLLKFTAVQCAEASVPPPEVAVWIPRRSPRLSCPALLALRCSEAIDGASFPVPARSAPNPAWKPDHPPERASYPSPYSSPGCQPNSGTKLHGRRAPFGYPGQLRPTEEPFTRSPAALGFAKDIKRCSAGLSPGREVCLIAPGQLCRS